MPKKTKVSAAHPVPALPGAIERRILLIRCHRVMLDSDLAELYGAETRALNQGVKRNRDRFPPDFMFQLTLQECRRLQILRSQIGEG